MKSCGTISFKLLIPTVVLCTKILTDLLEILPMVTCKRKWNLMVVSKYRCQEESPDISLSLVGHNFLLFFFFSLCSLGSDAGCF